MQKSYPGVTYFFKNFGYPMSYSRGKLFCVQGETVLLDNEDKLLELSEGKVLASITSIVPYSSNMSMGEEKLDKDAYEIFPFGGPFLARNKKDKHGRSINFMGFRFYREYTFVSKHILYSGTRKLRKISKKDTGVNTSSTWYDATQYLSYNGWYTETSTYNIISKTFENTNVSFSELKKKISNHTRMESFISKVSL